MDKNNYRGVWVFAEQRRGSLQKVSLELLGKGREIADELGVELTAILPGNNLEKMSQELSEYGADCVIAVENELLSNYTTDAYTNLFCDLIQKRKPEIFLIGATYIGRDLGPRIAARLATGLTADCTGLSLDPETKNLLMTRPAFGGNIMAMIECSEQRPQMATVRSGVFEKLSPQKNRSANIEKIQYHINEQDIRTKIEKVVQSAKEQVDISEAQIIVSGGRGIGCKENFSLIEELAKALGGIVGSSRAAVDSGWIEKTRQVGQTGKTVRPVVYFACGISGAIQHLAGMQDSDYIIAINKDKNAPIMNIADVAIVGDVCAVVPEIINQIRAAKQKM